MLNSTCLKQGAHLNRRVRRPEQITAPSTPNRDHRAPCTAHENTGTRLNSHAPSSTHHFQSPRTVKTHIRLLQTT